MVMVSSSGARVTVDMGVSYSRTPAWSDGASYRARPADLRNHGQILRLQSIVPPPREPQGGYSRFCCSRLSPGSRALSRETPTYAVSLPAQLAAARHSLAG